jgi:CubicO group peptidase (beta-lactamase class C family)
MNNHLLFLLFLIPILLCLFTASSVKAAELPGAKAAQVGFSAERLDRLSQGMQAYVEQKKVAGLVVLILRDGKVVYEKAFGMIDIEQNQPMSKNAIFRIASQTKAVTSTAIMMLQEEGRLLIDDPVSKYIPEFANARVAVQVKGNDSRGYSTIPLIRSITLRDLLTHTSGISYGVGPAKAEWEAAGLNTWFLSDKDMTIGQVVKKLATLPFDAQPGEKYIYGYNTDILGYVVECASGMSLANYFADKITGPLAMNDTYFFLPKEKLDRFTSVYGINEKGVLALTEDRRNNFYLQGPQKCYSGGGGLLSTARDYATFLLMLQQGGELNGVRLLSPKSIELMTANHVGDLYGSGGFGLGFWITDRLGRNGQLGTVGSFGWGGAYYTIYWVDPVEKMVVVLMTQMGPPAPDCDLHIKFRSLVYQAIIKSYE